MVKRSRAESASPSPEADAQPTDSAPSQPATPAEDAVPHVVKYVHVDAAGADAPKPVVMKCQLPPHGPLQFTSYDDYDVHYQEDHVNRCSECGKNFPTDQFLNLHLAEIHDPINDIRKARGEKIYACFADDKCAKKCSEPSKRRMHMVEKHHFPKNYDFAIIKDGIDGRTSMLRDSRHDMYTQHPKKGKPAKNAEKKAAKSPNLKEEGTTAMQQAPSDLSATMDITTPVKNEPPTPSSTQDVDMETGDGHQPNNLSVSKHATDKPRSAIAAAKQQKKKDEKGEQGEAAARSTGNGTVSSSKSVDDDTSNDPMERLTTSLSALNFVPPSIRFGRGGGRGRGRGRGGFARS
ncbi:hypothetical protein SLS56_000411 [Neofusicoccum ribis]|uniref:C2H2-type domain-containing protein n=1 Tax=Neofusicoccum ribis TaxID=45134 RepID=A0ABR3TEK7_9PEZI